MTRHLLVIGAQRCGTTYLMGLLASHPDISGAHPARPEPKVFCSPHLVAQGLGWYRRTYFAHAQEQQVLAEKSTSYMECVGAADAARSVLEQAHILVLLRDPVARAVSNWRLSTSHGWEDRPLDVSLRENLAGTRAWDPTLTSASPFAYLERGRYVDYLSPWLTAFPGSVRVDFLEDLVSTRAVIADLYAWLGVDDGHRPPDPDGRVNTSEGSSPHLDPVLRGRLRVFFRDSDARLAALLDRELPWTSR